MLSLFSNDHVHSVVAKSFVLLLLITVCPIIATATLQQSPPSPPRLSPSRATSISVPTSGPHCAKSPDWLTQKFNRDDCRGAMDRFFYTDWAKYGTTRFEFHNRLTETRTRFPARVVPRRYICASCVVIITTLWDFPDQPPLPPLPGDDEAGIGRELKKIDVMSFQAVSEALKRIGITCFDLGQLGWEPMGPDKSVGVFIMAMDSEVERNIKVGWQPSLLAGAAVEVNLTKGIAALQSSSF